MAIGSASPPIGSNNTLDAQDVRVGASTGTAIGSAPSSPTAKRSAGRSRPRLSAGPALAIAAVVLVAWQIATQAHLIAAYILPAPADVVRSFWSALTSGLLGGYIVTTLQESVIGFVVGTLVALPIGYAIARSRVLARALEPYLAASQALPAVALAPLLVIWLPIGEAPVVVLCALIAFFPTAVNTALGMRTLDGDVVDAGRVDGAARWALLWHIELPLALPSILAGLRNSLTLSITGAVVGEFVIGDQGLGGLLTIARGNFDTPLEFATLFTLMLLAAAMYGIARLAERRLSYLEA